MYPLFPLPLPGSDKTLNNGGTAEEQIFNLFQVTGNVELLALGCTVRTALAAGLTLAYFDLWDGTASIPLTLNNGVISSLPKGSWFGKTGLAAATMAIASSAAGALTTHASEQNIFKRVILTQKAGTATYIRFRYTSAGASTGVITPYARWAPAGVTGVLVPV